MLNLLRAASLTLCLGMVLSLAAADAVQSQVTPEITDVELDARLAHTIPVTANEQGVATLMFPGPITGIYMAQVQSGGNQVMAPFVIDFKNGNSFFSVKATGPEGSKGAINVIYNRRVYVIKLISQAQGMSSVNFVERKVLGPPIEAGRAVTPNLQIACIDRAKMYHLFLKQAPEQVADIAYDAPQQVQEGENLRTHLIEVMRFDYLDTLVFHCVVENKTDRELIYNPNEVAVAVGPKKLVMRASLADGSGKIPAKAKQHLYFTIVGDGTGDRNRIAVNNKFEVLVPVQVQPTATEVADSILRDTGYRPVVSGPGEKPQPVADGPRAKPIDQAELLRRRAAEVEHTHSLEKPATASAPPQVVPVPALEVQKPEHLKRLPKLPKASGEEAQ